MSVMRFAVEASRMRAFLGRPPSEALPMSELRIPCAAAITGVACIYMMPAICGRRRRRRLNIPGAAYMAGRKRRPELRLFYHRGVPRHVIGMGRLLRGEPVLPGAGQRLFT